MTEQAKCGTCGGTKHDSLCYHLEKCEGCCPDCDSTCVTCNGSRTVMDYPDMGIGARPCPDCTPKPPDNMPKRAGARPSAKAGVEAWGVSPPGADLDTDSGQSIRGDDATKLAHEEACPCIESGEARSDHCADCAGCESVHDAIDAAVKAAKEREQKITAAKIELLGAIADDEVKKAVKAAEEKVAAQFMERLKQECDKLPTTEQGALDKAAADMRERAALATRGMGHDHDCEETIRALPLKADDDDDDNPQTLGDA